ncbi:MAG: cellulase family glycosylhydrolase [Polyangia bacterium]
MTDAPFRFVLGNAFYLQEEAARGRIDRVDEVLGKLARLGCKVVRTWAFNDDPQKDSAIRRSADGVEEVGLRGLDVVLDRARAHGVRLILPLVDYWGSYGGTRQWCRWLGHGDAIEGDPRFFVDAAVRRAYFAHVAALLSRHNERTGLRYGEDPVVYAWELMNEPRGVGVAPEAWLAWVRDAATVVRSHATQLVSLGDEGQQRSFEGHDEAFWRRANGAHLFAADQGASFSASLDLVDVASAHLYPEKAGITPGLEREAGVRWIVEHAAIARAAGKPLIVGEFGLGNERASFARFPLPQRRAIYRTWLGAAIRAGVAGIGPWLFHHDDRPDTWDDFAWYVRDGVPLGSPKNRYADLVRDAADEMAEVSQSIPPPSR